MNRKRWNYKWKIRPFEDPSLVGHTVDFKKTILENNGHIWPTAIFGKTVILCPHLIDHKTRYGINKSCGILEFSEFIFEPVTIWMNFPSVFHVIWTDSGIHVPELTIQWWYVAVCGSLGWLIKQCKRFQVSTTVFANKLQFLFRSFLRKLI